MTGPLPHLGSKERTTSAEWKEEAHTVLMNISKHSTLATQTVLFGFRPTMCKRFWWLLARHRGPKSFACIVRDMCKICEIVTLNAVKVASDVCLLFLFFFFFCTCDKSDGISKRRNTGCPEIIPDVSGWSLKRRQSSYSGHLWTL